MTAADSIEAHPRWSTMNLVDGYFFEAVPADKLDGLASLLAERERLFEAALDDATRREWMALEQAVRETDARFAALPPPGLVYAATTEFPVTGSFSPTRGKPRPVHLLQRGSEQRPAKKRSPLRSRGFRDRHPSSTCPPTTRKARGGWRWLAGLSTLAIR